MKYPMKDFVLCWDEGQQQYYAFRAQTGETIYGATEEGDVTGLDRNLSAWRRPLEHQPTSLGTRVFTQDPSVEAWGRQRPMALDKATGLYEKRYDFGTGFFFWVSLADKQTLWNKPLGVPANMPCADLDESGPTKAGHGFDQTDESGPTKAVHGFDETALGGTLGAEAFGAEAQLQVLDTDGQVSHHATTIETAIEAAREAGLHGTAWRAFYDDAVGVEYWTNDETMESTYDYPPELAAIEAALEAALEGGEREEGERERTYTEGVDSYALALSPLAAAEQSLFDQASTATGADMWASSGADEEPMAEPTAEPLAEPTAEPMAASGAWANDEASMGSSQPTPPVSVLAPLRPVTSAGGGESGGHGKDKAKEPTAAPYAHPGFEAKQVLEQENAGVGKTAEMLARGPQARPGDVAVDRTFTKGVTRGRLRGEKHDAPFMCDPLKTKADPAHHGRQAPFTWQPVGNFAADRPVEGALSESLVALRKAQVVLAHFAEVKRLQQGLPPSGYLPGTLGNSGYSVGAGGSSAGSKSGGNAKSVSRPTTGVTPQLSPRAALVALSQHTPELLPPRAKLPWIVTRRPRPYNNGRAPYLDAGSIHEGPYIKRSGVGKHMTRAVHRLPPSTSLEDRVGLAHTRGDRFFLGPGDINYEDWALGESVSAFDGRVIRNSTLEPMMLCRAAFEDGPEAVVEVMGAFRHRGDVQAFGLMNLAKVDYVETAHGHAHPGGLQALAYVLGVMPDWVHSESVQGKALAVLSALADNYAMRREMFKEDWVTPAVAAMNAKQQDVSEIWLDHGPDFPKEKKTIRRPTRYAAELCTWACKLFGQMACDNARRAVVADDGIPLVLHAMTFCPDDGLVQLTACKALYNFVYRCESAHVMATEEDAMAHVEPLLESFTADPDVVRLAQRTIRALQADGWRGGADDTGKVVGGGSLDGEKRAAGGNEGEEQIYHEDEFAPPI